MKRTSTLLVLLFSLSSFAQAPKPQSAGDIFSALERLRHTGTILYIAAHPDDENSRFLSYCVNDRHLRAAYLSMTRGDGGQNLVGKEQGDALGVLRTQELLAARRVDGAEQFFTRAVDFGYSKNPEETFSIWNHDSILSDVVWIIRCYRPDIIVTRFATDGSGGHGHHTASAILAEEAFTAAADPSRYAWQLQYVKPWQARSLYHNTATRYNVPDTALASQVQIDVGTYLPWQGKSVGEISAESRSMHRSQGFGTARVRGSIYEYFQPVKGDTASRDLFSATGTDWSRIAGGEKAGKMMDKIAATFQPSQPSASVPALIKLYDALEELKDTVLKKRKQDETRELILSCAGIFTETVARWPDVAPGDTTGITTTVVNRTSIPCRLAGWSLRSTKSLFDSTFTVKLEPSRIQSLTNVVRLPAEEKLSNPWWLDAPHSQGLFTASDAHNIGKPVNDAALTSLLPLEIAGHLFTVSRPVQFREVDPSFGERYRPLLISPPVTAQFAGDAYVFPSDSSRTVVLHLRAWRDSIHGNIRLALPQGWSAQPAQSEFDLPLRGDQRDISFAVTPPAKTSQGNVTVEVQCNGQSWSAGFAEVNYDYIPVQNWFPPARSRIVRVALQKKMHNIGYIPGAGDDVPGCLRQLGYNVTILDEKTMQENDLKNFDAIVTGVRAYNTDNWLPAMQKKLQDFMEAGGNFVVQYNTNNSLGPLLSNIGPYPFKISRDRVTHEDAPVTFEIPGHAIFYEPNIITPEDFDGWIQERGIYFATDWDSHYMAPMSMNDPGEKPLKGSTIIADVGKGHFVYTGLAFFRELPAGVPGAYRLFVNLLEIGEAPLLR